MTKLKNLSALGFCLVFVASAAASDLEDVLLNFDQHRLSLYENEVNVGEIIDDNLGSIQNGLQFVDPFKMADIPLKGKGELTNGWLNNLSKIQRTGDCSVHYSNKVLTFTFNLGWKDLTYDYDYKFKLLLVTKTGQLRGSISKMNVRVSLSVDFNDLMIVLHELKFTEVGKLDLKLKGDIGEIGSKLAKLILNLAKKQIIGTIEKVANSALSQVIEEINNRIPRPGRQFRFVDLNSAGRHSRVYK